MAGICQEKSGDFPVGILLPFSVCFSDVFLQEPAGTFWHGQLLPQQQLNRQQLHRQQQPEQLLLEKQQQRQQRLHRHQLHPLLLPQQHLLEAQLQVNQRSLFI